MIKRHKGDFWKSNLPPIYRCETDMDKRSHIIAEYLISKEYSRKLKGRFKTLQMGIENENLLHERVRSLELELQRESRIYDKVRREKNRTSSLRRQFVYWRLFYQNRLTISMISWLLNVKSTTLKSNIGAAYHKLSGKKPRA
jgi:hypothetical protein